MLLFDVNVLISALRIDSDLHEDSLGILKRTVNGDEPFGWNSGIHAAVVRITSNRSNFANPTTPQEALAFCRAIQGSPQAVQLEPGRTFWPVFENVVTKHEVAGRSITDAFLAALAIDNSATFVSWDKGLRRFDRLHLMTPIEALALE